MPALWRLGLTAVHSFFAVQHGGIGASGTGATTEPEVTESQKMRRNISLWIKLEQVS
jgi:hypothetical protein